MSPGRGTLGIIGLVLSLAVLLLTAWLLLRTSGPSTSTSAEPGGVGAPPPQAARQEVLHQLCLSGCVTDEHNCRALVIDPGGETTCATTRATCEHACP